MRENQVKGKVIFVSSTLALTAIPGYAPYTPTKWAIRGFADTLESELRLYDITVHHVYPPGMDTPGFKQENLTKPAVTKEIEGAADVFTPQQVAVKLISGVERHQYHITVDVITWLLRVVANGTAPRPSLFLEMFILPLLAVSPPPPFSFFFCVLLMYFLPILLLLFFFIDDHGHRPLVDEQRGGEDQEGDEGQIVSTRRRRRRNKKRKREITYIFLMSGRW